MSILVIAEHTAGQLTQATLRVLGAVSHWHLPVHLLLAATAEEMSTLRQQTAQFPFIDELLIAESSLLHWPEPSIFAELLQPILINYQAMVTPHQLDMVTALGLLSCLEGSPLITDIVSFGESKNQQLPSAFLTAHYDQQAWRWVENADHGNACLLLTLQAGRFALPEMLDTRLPPMPVQTLVVSESPLAAKTLNHEKATNNSQRLDEAKIVIAGGRPLGKRFMQTIKPLASRLSASIGATRGAVDAGLVPFTCQIGQTGSHIAPELYIAVGLSGAPQHVAGIGQSRVIVAINKDISAPICQMADYILQGDMFELLPQLCEAIDHKDVADIAELIS
ncbi:MAG: electron transfer flavoprotein subunit alpha/FixB family protein [Tolumonas sp.]|nr:electron transfer flavoprotein subunit alpha/FixB family protein [Tolumonas sp.]